MVARETVLSGSLIAGFKVSNQGLEIIETTSQKTYEWIARIAESTPMEKRDAWKSLRAVLQTLRDCLPVNLAVNFGAQLPMLMRGAYYDGWKPCRVPVALSREEFVAVVQSRMKADRVIEPFEAVQNVLTVIANHIGRGEMHKIFNGFPSDMQVLFPAFTASAAPLATAI